MHREILPIIYHPPSSSLLRLRVAGIGLLDGGGDPLGDLIGDDPMRDDPMEGDLIEDDSMGGDLIEDDPMGGDLIGDDLIGDVLVGDVDVGLAVGLPGEQVR